MKGEHRHISKLRSKPCTSASQAVLLFAEEIYFHHVLAHVQVQVEFMCVIVANMN